MNNFPKFSSIRSSYDRRLSINVAVHATFIHKTQRKGEDDRMEEKLRYHYYYHHNYRPPPLPPTLTDEEVGVGK